jgi:hypothetical protein
MHGKTTHLATILVLLYLPLCPIYTQHNLMLHHFSGIPQASLTNPGLFPDSTLQIGLPIISQINLSASNNGFRFRDAGARGWNFSEIELSYGQLSNLVRADNRLLFDASVPLFFVGLRHKSAYFALSAREVVTGGFRYNRDAVRFGAAIEQDQFSAGQQFRFGDFAYQFTHYRDWSATVAHQLNRLTMGIRLHYLSGRENQVSGGTGIVATVDDEGDGLTFNGMLSLLSAGRSTFLGDAPYRFRGTGNRGFAVDLGGTYFVNPQLNLSASIINLGGINWNKATDRQIIMSPLSEPVSAINNIIDHAVSQHTSDSISYRSSLPTTAYLGGTYQIDDKSQVKLLFSPRFGGNNIPGLGLSMAYSRHLKQGLEMALAYSIINQRYFNVGMGLTYTKGAVQFYLLSDNALSFFSPASQYTANIQSGINLLLNSDQLIERSKTVSQLADKAVPTVPSKQLNLNDILEKKNPYIQLSGTIISSTGHELPAYFHLDVYLINHQGKKDLIRTGRQQGMKYTTYLKRGYEHVLVFHLDNFPPYELSISKQETAASANSIEIDITLHRHTQVEPVPTIPHLPPQLDTPESSKVLPEDWVSDVNRSSKPIEEPKPVLVSHVNKKTRIIVPLFETFGGQGDVLLEIKDIEQIIVLEQTTSQWWMVAYKDEIGWIEADKIIFD